MKINWEEQLGSETDQVSMQGNKASELLTKIPVRAEVVEKIPSLTGEFVGETHRVLEYTQNHPPWNQHQKGPICLWVVAKVTESP